MNQRTSGFLLRAASRAGQQSGPSCRLSPPLTLPAPVPWNGAVIAGSPQLQHSCHVLGLDVQIWDLVLILQLHLFCGSLSELLAPSASLRTRTCEWAGWNGCDVPYIRTTKEYFIKNTQFQTSLSVILVQKSQRCVESHCS